MILAIDPGIRSCGWALFGPDKRLLRCGLVQTKSTNRHLGDDAATMAAAIGFGSPHVILEEMVLRPEDPKSQAEDLLRVQLVGGIVAGRCGGRVTTVHPMRWKGAVPKRIHQSRIRDELSEAERAVLEAGTAKVRGALKHNVLDAVGIGLWGVGRMRP